MARTAQLASDSTPVQTMLDYTVPTSRSRFVLRLIVILFWSILLGASLLLLSSLLLPGHTLLDRTIGIRFHPRADYVGLHGSDKSVEVWRIRSQSEVVILFWSILLGASLLLLSSLLLPGHTLLDLRLRANAPNLDRLVGTV
jgi:hypothetical protein